MLRKEGRDCSCLGWDGRMSGRALRGGQDPSPVLTLLHQPRARQRGQNDSDFIMLRMLKLT